MPTDEDLLGADELSADELEPDDSVLDVDVDEVTGDGPPEVASQDPDATEG